MQSKLARAVTTFFMIILLMLAGVLTIPRLAGCKTFIVLGSSMEPGLPVGSLVYVQSRTRPETIEVNDIITFYGGNGGMAVTHRVTAVSTSGCSWTTKGDANRTPDGPVPFGRLIGRVVFYIPLLGYLAVAIKTHEMILLTAALILLVVAVLLSPIIKSQKPGV